VAVRGVAMQCICCKRGSDAACKVVRGGNIAPAAGTGATMGYGNAAGRGCQVVRW